jgi:hypothetical protein
MFAFDYADTMTYARSKGMYLIGKFMSYIKQRDFLCPLILGIMIICGSQAWALDTTLRLHGGYNSNTECVKDGPSSGFAQVDLHLAQDGSIFSNTAFQVFADGSTTKANAWEYRITLGGALQGSMVEDRLHPGVMYTYSRYRDDNDRNANSLDVNANCLTLWSDWRVNNEMTLAVEQVLNWQNYLYPVITSVGGIYVYRVSDINSPSFQSWGSYSQTMQNFSSLYSWFTTDLPNDIMRSILQGIGLLPQTPTLVSATPVTDKRDDLYTSTTLRATYTMSPQISLDLSAAREHVDSTIDAAIYRRYALGIGALWNVDKHWEIIPQARWFLTNYKMGYPGDDDPDITKLLGLGVNYKQDKYTLGWRIERLTNDSPFEHANYERTVAECIVSYLF